MGSIAHATALHAAGLIHTDELEAIREGLIGIREEIEAGSFSGNVSWKMST